MLAYAPKEDANTYTNKISLLNTARVETKELFRGFLNLTANCSQFGGYLNTHLISGILSYIVGGTLSLSAAYCHNTMGDNWLELRPGIECEIGLRYANYPFLGLIKGNHNEIGTRHSLSFSPTASISLGILVVGRVQTMGDWIDQIGLDFTRGMRAGVGMGAS